MIVVCSGAAQGLVLLARALGAPHVAMEDPGLPPHRGILAAHGARLSALPVDAQGACVAELKRIEAQRGPIDAVFVTPAHQSPMGVALAPGRRAELLEWASSSGGLVIEDDYDAEYRYDRAPLAALQGLASDRVIYMGTVSKTLAPAMRLGWLVPPPRWLDAVLEQKTLADHGCPTLDQLALARLLESGAYDRHLRQARRRHRARRDALVSAVERHLPDAHVTGLAAGLHAIVRLPRQVDGLALMHAASERSVGVYPLGYAYMEPKPVHDGLVLGYASLSEAGIEEGIRLLAQALAELDAEALGDDVTSVSAGRAAPSVRSRLVGTLSLQP
jgi:GntR family transcriptional regulator/MocR family aminotransferase